MHSYMYLCTRNNVNGIRFQGRRVSQTTTDALATAVPLGGYLCVLGSATFLKSENTGDMVDGKRCIK